MSMASPGRGLLLGVSLALVACRPPAAAPRTVVATADAKPDTSAAPAPAIEVAEEPAPPPEPIAPPPPMSPDAIAADIARPFEARHAQQEKEREERDARWERSLSDPGLGPSGSLGSGSGSLGLGGLGTKGMGSGGGGGFGTGGSATLGGGTGHFGGSTKPWPTVSVTVSSVEAPRKEAAIVALLRVQKHRLMACAARDRKADWKATLAFDVLPTGKLAAVTLGAGAPKTVKRCIESLVQRLELAPATGPKSRVEVVLDADPP
ncbi:MAG: hypothetical protein R3B72_12730 [Polyangiaceae bacterium]